ncbi:MAG: hypothetical protein M5U17_12640 [Ignavibacterium sp.]|nr:hypothetical protein [Ignavibacterium sp.]
MKRDLVSLGSKTAKSRFENEDDVVKKFNNWTKDLDAQEWLVAMDYKINEIESVTAVKVPGHHKADVQVQVTIKLKKAIGLENISLKLVTTSTGFNQIDKREIDKYVEMWDIPSDITEALKLFTGKTKPTIKGLTDPRRMLLTEMPEKMQKKIVDFFSKNKILVVSDLLKGNDEFSADWFMVVWKIPNENPKWIIKDINFVLNFYGDGEVRITRQGSLVIGKIGMQRKGGDGGRPSSQMLQFKINPLALFQNDI